MTYTIQSKRQLGQENHRKMLFSLCRTYDVILAVCVKSYRMKNMIEIRLVIVVCLSGSAETRLA